ncbi:Nuclear nucleic acid-binding protein C1D [Aphelenchoides besseyi]|nr:Nuclear nucleic acid-binding protein C1D [Aphelenchoides besseyi]
MSAEIPQPVLQVLSKLSKELNDVEKSLVELQKVTPEERESLPLLQRAKLDVMSAQIILKLYCTYSSTFGQNPDEDEENIGVYTRRIEEATKRIQEEEDRPLRPKIQKRAARSFVRSSLFDPSKQQENGNGKLITIEQLKMMENEGDEQEVEDDAMEETYEDDTFEFDDQMENF